MAKKGKREKIKLESSAGTGHLDRSAEPGLSDLLGSGYRGSCSGISGRRTITCR